MNIRLRGLESRDCQGMIEWMRDAETIHFFHDNMKDKTQEDVLNFIAASKTTPSDGDNIHYAIVDDLDVYLGTISLKNINLADRNAEYAISLRKSAQGKGIAYFATSKLLKIAFLDFELQKVYLNVLSDNYRAIRLYEKCGFRLEGEFKSHFYLEGIYKDLRWYAMLKEEYINIYCR